MQPTSTPEPTSHIIEHQSHDTGISSILLVVVIAVALAGLAVLGIVVFVMNRGGPEELYEQLKAFVDRFRRR